MCNRPEWLPPIQPLQGDWDKDLANLHAIFTKCFIDSRCVFKDQLVWPDKRKLDGGDYEEGFWHLITQDDESKYQRLFDMRRAERLCWLRPVIENHADARVKTFVWLHKGKTPRIHIWLEDCDYIVILETSRNGRLANLITAYHLEGEGKRAKYAKRYEERID